MAQHRPKQMSNELGSAPPRVRVPPVAMSPFSTQIMVHRAGQAEGRALSSVLVHSMRWLKPARDQYARQRSAGSPCWLLSAVICPTISGTAEHNIFLTHLAFLVKWPPPQPYSAPKSRLA